MKRAQSEFRLACFVADALRWGCRPDVVWTHFPAGENRNEITGARLKRMGLLRGVADYMLVLPGARVAFLELKATKGRLSDDQKAFRDRVEALGCRYEVVRTGDEAIQILTSMGILERVRVCA